MLNFAHKCALLTHKNLFLHPINYKTINAQEMEGSNMLVVNKDKNPSIARYWQFSENLKILKNNNLKKFSQKIVVFCY